MHRVILWQDGKVNVFGNGNTRLKDFEGKYKDVKDKILEGAISTTLFVLADSRVASRSVKLVTRHEWANSQSHLVK